jgi:hypothetical protein
LDWNRRRKRRQRHFAAMPFDDMSEKVEDTNLVDRRKAKLVDDSGASLAEVSWPSESGQLKKL